MVLGSSFKIKVVPFFHGFSVLRVRFVYKCVYLLNTLEVRESGDCQAPIFLTGE